MHIPQPVHRAAQWVRVLRVLARTKVATAGVEQPHLEVVQQVSAIGDVSYQAIQRARVVINVSSSPAPKSRAITGM